MRRSLTSRGGESRGAVGRAPSGAAIRKVEAHHRHAGRDQGVGEGGERDRVHVGSRAMGEQHRAVGAALRALEFELGDELQHAHLRMTHFVRKASARSSSSTTFSSLWKPWPSPSYT